MNIYYFLHLLENKTVNQSYGNEGLLSFIHLLDIKDLYKKANNVSRVIPSDTLFRVLRMWTTESFQSFLFGLGNNIYYISPQHSVYVASADGLVSNMPTLIYQTMHPIVLRPKIIYLKDKRIESSLFHCHIFPWFLAVFYWPSSLVLLPFILVSV